MTFVSQVLEAKGSELHSLPPDATVFEALERMAQKNVGALLVIDRGKLAGIFSERDYARKVALFGKTSRETRVREVMSTDVVCVNPRQTIEECMSLMTENRIRHLPVLEGEGVAGVVSIGDVVKAIIADREFQLKQLEGYIAGSPPARP